MHAGIQTGLQVIIRYIESESIEREGVQLLAGVSGIVIPGGFGRRGVEGKITGARYARERGLPYLGICLGMHVAVIDFARSQAGLSGANSTEFDPDTRYPVLGRITQWQDKSGQQQIRDAQMDKGGTMRLGGQLCRIRAGSLAHRLYKKRTVLERHRHRYEVNPVWLSRLEEAGLQVCGRSVDAHLVEMIALPSHPWFLGCQFHPEFTSNPRQGHPVFNGFVRAVQQYQKSQKEGDTVSVAVEK